MSYEPALIPSNCAPSDYNGSLAKPAITIGAGVNFDEVYAFAREHNVTYIGGYASTIGAAGGWVQGGGHSTLSPLFGLGADRVLQFKVVTPDGVLRTANACQHTDLF